MHHTNDTIYTTHAYILIKRCKHQNFWGIVCSLARFTSGLKMHIIIFEGNSPQLLANNRRAGIDLSATHYGRALQACNSAVTYEVAEPYQEDFSLESLNLAKFDGVVFTGSGVSWSTQDHQCLPQQKAMEAVFRAQLPTLGSCNGMQLAATVLGGSVRASPNGRELGVARDIQLTEFGSSHAYHLGRKSGFCSPCIHRDEVHKLPVGAELTATNNHSQVQAMVYEKDGIQFWGTQYHPEYTLKQMCTVLQKPGTLFQADPKYVDALIAIDEGGAPGQKCQLLIDPSDFSEAYRMTELRNWISFIEEHSLAA